MAGVYVAKPPIIVIPNYPPRWDIHWIFPGPPFPPGYNPLYAMVMTTPPTVTVGSAASVFAGVVDDSYMTSEPAGQIGWSATKEGSPLKMMFSGGGEFFNGVNSNYSSNSGFYGASPDLMFDISASDVGKTIVLSAGGSPFGSALSQTAEILVVGDIYKIVVTVTLNSVSMTPALNPNGSVAQDSLVNWSINENGDAVWNILIANNSEGGDYSIDYFSGSYSVVFDSLNTTSTLNNLTSNPTKTYNISAMSFAADPGMGATPGSASISVTFNVKVYKNNVLTSESEKHISCSGSEEIDDTIDIHP